ncbi:MAG TPA: hypothetical protein EYN38_02270 [Flavobacteriales bacterium]|nr:hypothetical protein [Flavobacteriales bacterium]HIA11467.1 hypothetical protein [Flavobacteriales bacterium]HIO71910.1 hypothetical protein [Flavobacteriales bacterium]
MYNLALHQRRIRIALLCAITILSPNLYGQASFKKSIGETDFYNRGNAVQQTKDGGYVVVGRTVSFGGGGVQAYLVKSDAIGKTLWTKQYGGRGSEEGLSIRETADGGFIITGYTNSRGAGKTDVYLIKTKSTGDTLWTRTYGGIGLDQGNSVWETKDGGYIIAGETYSFGKGTVNAYILKVKQNGDTAWTKVYGGSGIEQGNSVQETSDGGFIITGRTNSFGAGDYDVYLIRSDIKGKKMWMQTFGGTGSEEGNCVAQTADGGYIITGYTESFGAGGVDVYLVRADKDGNQMWTKTFGGKTDDYGMSVQQTHDGGFVVAGYSNSFGRGIDAYLIRTDENGNVKWTSTFGDDSDDYGNSVDQTDDGGFVIGGSTVISQPEGEKLEKTKNVYLIKTDATGN